MTSPKSIPLDLGSTFFLRGVVILMGLLVLTFCILTFPAALDAERTGNYQPILLGIYVSAVPFCFALYQTLKLLSYIAHGKAFSGLSVRALQLIKYSAIAISAMYTAGLPYIYVVADRDDAPGVLAVALVITFASMVVGVFAAVLQKLLRSAIDIKSENDLTV